jgi:hypothetical protein
MKTSTVRRVLAPSALVLAGIAGLFGVAQLRRASETPSSASQADIAELVTGGLVRKSSSNGMAPAFDVARVEPSGNAVIAGSAAPGAAEELLRNGEVQDRVVADRSGEFLMTPSDLPAGEYKLTLRATQSDGKQEISKQSVAVVIRPSLKEQPAVSVVTPDKVDDSTTSYRSLPPLTFAPETAPIGRSHQESRRRFGHFFHRVDKRPVAVLEFNHAASSATGPSHR